MKQVYFACTGCGESFKNPEVILAIRILDRDGFVIYCSTPNCTGQLEERVASTAPETSN